MKHWLMTICAMIGLMTNTPAIASPWLDSCGTMIAANPFQEEGAVYVNNVNGQGLQSYPPGQWATVDLAAYLPPGTVAAELSGLLLITFGKHHGACQLTVAWRAVGDQTDWPYHGQALTEPWGSERETYTVKVPIDANGQVEMKWDHCNVMADGRCAEAVFGHDWVQPPEWCGFGLSLRPTVAMIGCP